MTDFPGYLKDNINSGLLMGGNVDELDLIMSHKTSRHELEIIRK